jgi:hypothetical protein
MFTLQPKIESNKFSNFQKNIFKTRKNKMKQLHNISHLNSRQRGVEPTGQGYACIVLLDSEFVKKRCLYKWVS